MNKPLTLGLVAALLIGTGLYAPPAQAQPSSFIVTLTQEGPNVVATGSGTINITDLHFDVDSELIAGILPNGGLLLRGRLASPRQPFTPVSPDQRISGAGLGPLPVAAAE
jgi:hypothetical protein